jgi:hypothetical protein
MKWKKEQIILLIVIAALAAYLVVQKNGRTHYDLPSVARIPSKNITKLLIKNKDSLITLRKKGEVWVIEPQGYPADKGIVESLLADIGGLTVTALASEAGNEAVYELDTGHRIEAEVYEGDKPVRKIEIGKTSASGGHTFVELDGHAGIYHAENDLRRDFDKTIPDLRDKIVLKIDGDINELVLTKNKKNLTIRKTLSTAVMKGKKEQAKQETGPKWRIAGKKPANDAHVDDLINTLSNLTCDDFIEGKEKKDFRAPLYTVLLKGMKTYTLAIYRGKDKTYAEVSSESSYPFQLSRWKAKKIMLDFGSLTAAGN